MENGETVTISKKEYERLLRNSEFLSRLVLAKMEKEKNKEMVE